MKTCLEIIEELGTVELKPIGKDLYRGWCPMHFDNKAGGKPQFTYYSSSDSFFCFRCGIGGDAIRLVAEMEHISYSEAKKRLVGTEVEQLEELKETLDNLDVEISSSYNLQLNLTLRPKFRDLLYKYPKHEQDILMAMKALDEELKNKITFEKMGKLFERFKLFSEQIVAESANI
jgi:DNA primase